MKQDMNGVRTAQDLEQKYNLGAISEIQKETQRNTEQITSTNNELKDFTTQVTKDMVVKLARKIHLDTIYLLEGDQNHE